MSIKKQSGFSWRRGAAALFAGALVLGIAGCADVDAKPDETGKVAEVKQDPKAPITVWVDATRLPMAEAFVKANPSPKVNIVTVDQNATGADSLQGKIALADKAGKGWPDVIWSSRTTESSWTTKGKTPYAAKLDEGLIAKDKLDAFQGSALAPCTVDGHIVCLRNDLAQNVLWYNKTLMDQFGYEVPKTWEEFAAIGERLSKEHPGYVMGSIGDGFAPGIYFWGAGCPASNLKGTDYSVDLTDEKCVKMAKLIDGMVANKSLTTDAYFAGTTYLDNYGQKTLMAVGPSWFGKYLFADYFKVPAGQMAAATTPAWEGEEPVAGNVGGGTWIMSSHSTNAKFAAKFLDFVATDIDLQSTQGTYPAYGPAAEAWLKNPANVDYFAADVSSVFEEAATLVWPEWSQSSLVDPNQIWSATLAPRLIKGETVESLLPVWQEQAEKLVPTVGYTLKK